ncbi:hypothetical protein PHAVU_002G256904 [Phaseolus vulgaris]
MICEGDKMFFIVVIFSQQMGWWILLTISVLPFFHIHRQLDITCPCHRQSLQRNQHCCCTRTICCCCCLLSRYTFAVPHAAQRGVVT